MKEKILLLLASPNREGNSSTLGQWFLSDINKERYEVEKIYLYDLKIDYYTADNYKCDLNSDTTEPDVKMLFTKMQEANHIVVATPIWNFGVPAVLKNLLDRLSYFAKPWLEEKQARVPAWKKKKFYILFTTGAPWFGVFMNFVAFCQLKWTLGFYGTKSKIVGLAFKCGNGSKNVVNQRSGLKNKIVKRGKKKFK